MILEYDYNFFELVFIRYIVIFKIFLWFLRVNFGNNNKDIFWVVFFVFVILLYLIYLYELVIEGFEIKIKLCFFFLGFYIKNKYIYLRYMKFNWFFYDYIESEF